MRTMLIFFKIIYQWKVTLFKIILLVLVSVSVCALPIETSTTSEEFETNGEISDPHNLRSLVSAVPYRLKRKTVDVLSANLKSIIQREYDKYFNYSWLNGDDPSHECLLGSSHFYLWWLDADGRVRPKSASKDEAVLDLSNKRLSDIETLSDAWNFTYKNYVRSRTSLTVIYIIIIIIRSSIDFLHTEVSHVIYYRIIKHDISTCLGEIPNKNSSGVYKEVHIINIQMYNSVEDKVKILSLANNHLTSIPKFLLQTLSPTLERLSLMGNNFTGLGTFDVRNKSKNSFPRMMKLRTLDMRYCHLKYIEDDAFASLHNLNKLILSYNKIQTISLSAFSSKNVLRHLDLSYNFDPVDEIDDNSTERMEPFKSLVEGLFFKPRIFDKVLKSLRFLDLSHTKLHAFSGIALAYLGEEIEQLSLCYTQIPIIAEKMFKHTNLRVLDLSGNQGLPSTFSNTSLAGLENKLEILSFENAYVKHIHWISQLKGLQILRLRRNNINSMPLHTFRELNNLKIVDLSSNHLSHWYERIIYNHSVQVLDLRDNNINVLSKEMIRDFRMVDYLAIGGNMFICNCILNDFLEIALRNTIKSDCDEKEPFMDSARSMDTFDQYDAYTRILNDYLSELKENHQMIDDYFTNHNKQHPEIEVYDPVKKTHANANQRKSVNCNLVRNRAKFVEMNEIFLAESEKLYKVQLLDYAEDQYKCINSNSTKSYTLAELEPCSYADTHLYPTNDNVPTDVLILYPLIIVMCVTVLIIFIYYRGYDIKYFCITCRNVTVLSLLDKDKRKLLNKRNKSEVDEYLYDVFVSYSEQNRDWVLDHLLPNIEQRDGINVCLHERDFKVGLTILENIISCIDQSRTILLVISQSFVSSNWCQFELHLAQHRLLETRREQLVLVLLESIPRITRPRTLQYLMRTKTYLKWPTEKRKKNGRTSYSPSDIIEQRKLFFKRLKQAIVEQS